MKKTKTDRGDDRGKPYADFERTKNADALAEIPLGAGRVRDFLDQDAAELKQKFRALGRLMRLPFRLLRLVDRLRYGTQRWEGQRNLAFKTAEALDYCPDFAEAEGFDAAQIEELLDKRTVYQQFRYFGERLKNAAMDQRAYLGAYQWYLLDRLLTHLERCLLDPEVGEAEKARILDAFAGAVLAYGRMISVSLEQKQKLGAARQELGRELQDAEDQAADAEVEMAVRMGLPVAREALVAAARRYHERARQMGTQDPFTGTAPVGPRGTHLVG